jgi:hypothetical protein
MLLPTRIYIAGANQHGMHSLSLYYQILTESGTLQNLFDDREGVSD